MPNEQVNANSAEIKPNPALEGLVPLLGDWQLILTNASFLDDPSTTMETTASIRWIEQGAYLLITQGGENGVPSAYWMIGRDDSHEDYTVLYSDNRGVSRVYSMSFDNGEWHKWRAAPGFHQRFQARMSSDGRTFEGKWEKSGDGKQWEHDFDLTYQRLGDSVDRS